MHPMAEAADLIEEDAGEDLRERKTGSQKKLKKEERSGNGPVCIGNTPD